MGNANKQRNINADEKCDEMKINIGIIGKNEMNIESADTTQIKHETEMGIRYRIGDKITG